MATKFLRVPTLQLRDPLPQVEWPDFGVEITIPEQLCPGDGDWDTWTISFCPFCGAKVTAEEIAE